MSYYSLGIIFPTELAESRYQLEAFIGAQMAPFELGQNEDCYLDDEGELIEFDNLQGRWDFYEVGGGSHGWLSDVPPDSARFEDNVATVEQVIERKKFLPILITPKGLWLDCGYDQCPAILRAYPDHSMVLVTAHY